MADAPATPAPRRTPLHTARRGAARLLGPLWVTTFRDPVTEGRLRLEGLPPGARHLARGGLVALVVLLGSTLFASAWRRGELVPVDVGAGHQFVPPGVFAMTLVGLMAAWWLFTWGALAGSWLVRLATAAAYLLVNSNFSVPDAFGIGADSWAIEHGHALLQAGLIGPPAALLVAALTTRWPRADRWVVALARAVCVIGAAAAFLGLLWIHVTLVGDQQQSFMPSFVGGSMLSLDLLLLPVVYVAAVAVVDFALDVSTSLAEPATALRRRWVVLALVLALAVAKLGFEVAHRLDYWRVLVVNQPQAVLRTALCLAVLGAVVVAVTRFRRSEDTLAAKEDLTLAGAAVMSAPYALKSLVLSVGVLVLTQTDGTGVAEAVQDFPEVWLGTWGLLIVAVLTVPAGVLLMRRSAGGVGDELGSGMVVVGTWVAMALALSNSGLSLGFAYDAVDVLVTVAALVFLALRWRQADVGLLVLVGTVLGFSWLVTSRGDYLSFLGGLVGLPAVLVVVFGIVWTLASGSSFAAGTSARLPRPARTLLFLGYLLLSVVILHWNQTTHGTSSDADAFVAYYYLGIPLAAWLVGRHVGRPAALPAPAGNQAEDQAAAVLR